MTTRHGPDTTASVDVYLTPRELGRALTRRGDDEQVEALIEWVKGFPEGYTQAELQASYLGSRLFSRASERDAENVIRFLKMIILSCREDAMKIAATADIGEAL